MSDSVHRAMPHDESSARFARSCLENGLCQDMRTRRIGAIAPIFTSSVAYRLSPKGSPRFALGKGCTEEQASASAAGEALERLTFSTAEVVPATDAELSLPRISANDVLLFSASQLQDWEALTARGEDYLLVPSPDQLAHDEWAVCVPLSGSARRLVPASLVTGASARSFSDSNGCAVGPSLDRAIESGLLELVERDAVSIWWYNQLRVPPCPDSGFADAARRDLASKGRTLHLLDVTVDTGLPVCVAVSRAADGREVILGSGSGFTMDEACRQATLELFQCLPIVEHIGVTRSRMTTTQKWWFDNVVAANHPFLSPDPDSARLPSTCSKLEDLLERLAQLEIDAGYVQVSTGTSAVAVKVFAPGLRHFWRRLAPGRLYDVPVKIGRLPVRHEETDLFDVPFFL